MKIRYRDPALILLALGVMLIAVFAQSGGTYTPGEFQSSNPNYPKANPFYFEGKIDWNLLEITQPNNAWEYMERGIHYQDDMDDIPDAINDYQTSYSMNSLQNGTCQIVTAATLVNGTVPTQLTPMPCMFTVRLRLGYLLEQSQPSMSIQLFQEVLEIDPQRLGVNTLIAETYVIEAQQSTDPTTQQTDYANAVSAYQAELALSPITPQSTALTADTANNSKVHWELAQVYEAMGQNSLAANELQSYLQATEWHSDVYPWRITLAQKQIPTLLAQAKVK
jgi:tetratricopeptide (TPR) repeat protein